MTDNLEARCIAEEQMVLRHHYKVAINGHDPFLLSATKAELHREAYGKHKRMLARLLKLVDVE